MTTEAGQRLLGWMVENVYHPGMSYGPDDMAADIAAIEAEARAALLAELEAGVEELRVADRSWLAPSELFAAVLDLIRKAKGETA